MIDISLANSSHLEQLSLLFDGYRVFYQMNSNVAASKHFLQERFSNNDSLIFIATENRKILGFVQIYASFSSIAMQPTWTLNDLFIGEGSRRKGIAKLLIQHTEREAKNTGIFSIKLATQLKNDKAIALYRTLNYKQIDDFSHFSKRIRSTAD
jgi:ribosomal protein S18 acetylase RimI-like enzyme